LSNLKQEEELENTEPGLPIFELMMSLSDIVDLVSPVIEDHHNKVSFISLALAKELGWSDEEQAEIFLAASLHDIGAFSLKSKLDALDFELENPHEHSRIGYYLLKDFAPLEAVADVIRFHHVLWDNGAGREFEGNPVSSKSHLIHLADRIAVLIERDVEILGQRRGIIERITKNSGTNFVNEMTEAFLSIAEHEDFWLDLTSGSLNHFLKRHLHSNQSYYGEGSMLGVANLIRRFIDFRNRFTATHSIGVAVVAECLAELVGFDEENLQKIKVAGWLHDLGKVAIPTEILEKTGALTDEHINIMRKHPYYSYRALEYIDKMQEINQWISYHHERLDGKGYPFHLKGDQIPTGARIIAVADFFTAVTEDRPYRMGMPRKEALSVMKKMAHSQALDTDIINYFDHNFTEINSIRAEAQAASIEEYEEFAKLLHDDSTNEN